MEADGSNPSPPIIFCTGIVSVDFYQALTQETSVVICEFFPPSEMGPVHFTSDLHLLRMKSFILRLDPPFVIPATFKRESRKQKLRISSLTSIIEKKAYHIDRDRSLLLDILGSNALIEFKVASIKMGESNENRWLAGKSKGKKKEIRLL